MRKRAGTYLRISKDISGLGAAVERQRESGQALIRQRSWDLHREYVDNDISASGRKRRPGFEQLLSDIEAGEIEVVVAWALDRLTRNRRDQIRLIEACQEHRVTVALVNGADIDMSSAAGRMMADVLAGFARMEVDQKSERHVSQIAQAARNGRMVGGRRAFGYTADGLHLDPVEAPLLRQLYDRFLAGESMGSLARWLNELEALTPRGNRWRHHSLREVLANPRNAALRGMRPVVNRRTGTRAQWHEIIGPAVWPAVVAESTWRATLTLIKDPGRPGNHVGESRLKYLLSGIALCGVCGAPLITGGRAEPRRDGSGDMRYRLLRCPTLKHVSRRADYVEAFVEEQIIGYFSGPVQVQSVSPDDGVDLVAVRARAVELRAKKDGLARDYVDGILDREGVRVARERIDAQLSELDQAVAQAGMVDPTAALRAAADPEEVWDGMTVTEKRAVVRRIATVRVLRGAPGRPGGLRFDPDSVDVVFSSVRSAAAAALQGDDLTAGGAAAE